MSIKRRVEVMEKALEADSFSVIPKQDRVVVVSGHTPEERATKMTERLVEMHRKFGDFDESCLTRISIRKFSMGKVAI